MRLLPPASAAVCAAALALVSAGCGDDSKPSGTAATRTAAPAVTPAAARAAANDRADDHPAARPNVLGEGQDIGRTLDRLNQDLYAFFSDTLAPTGAKLSQPRVAAAGSGGTCEGKPVTGDESPRWCEAERTVLAPPQGADALRTRDGSVALYELLAWAHAQSVGSQLGWHAGVTSGKYTSEQVGEAEFCLMVAWTRYKFSEGVLEASDEAKLDPVWAGPQFASVPAAARERGIKKSTSGTEACVS